ncbi:hypothetical protein PMAYCL1PPCAC_17404, partial [Pristionchus mayeri]
VIVSTCIDRAMALHLIPAQKYATIAKKRKGNDSGKIDCFMYFEFPPPRQFSLFSKAKIGHVEVSNLTPISVDDLNLKYLSMVLDRCSVEKFTLVLHKETLTNL